MPHPLTIEISDPGYQTLEKWAAREGTTPEALASDWVARRLTELENDPLMRWAGAIDSDLSDVAEHHDHYLGESLVQELRDDRR
jgi:hypothetical protein